MFVGKKLKITQIRSYIGRPEKQRKILHGMGLGRLNRTVLLNNTPEIRGMVKKVIHLLSVEELEEGAEV
ncbi:MAG: 50S ribosomal protein L30 [Syntrophales bacterium]|nr:50S ribosomal protein L30 [Syntrophales bacterium]